MLSVFTVYREQWQTIFVCAFFAESWPGSVSHQHHASISMCTRMRHNNTVQLLCGEWFSRYSVMQIFFVSVLQCYFSPCCMFANVADYIQLLWSCYFATGKCHSCKCAWMYLLSYTVASVCPEHLPFLWLYMHAYVCILKWHWLFCCVTVRKRYINQGHIHLHVWKPDVMLGIGRISAPHFLTEDSVL